MHSQPNSAMLPPIPNSRKKSQFINTNLHSRNNEVHNIHYWQNGMRTQSALDQSPLLSVMK